MHHAGKCDVPPLQPELIDLQEHVMSKERRGSQNVVFKCKSVHVTCESIFHVCSKKGFNLHHYSLFVQHNAATKIAKLF